MYLINFSGDNESDKKFQIKEMLDNKNDVRHLLLGLTKYIEYYIFYVSVNKH